MSCLVSGATGYVGRALVKSLVAQGLEVHCPVRPSSDVSRLPREGVAIHTLHDGFAELDGAFGTGDVETVFHLATHQPADASPGEVARVLEANVEYGTQLLEAARRAGVRRIVNTSSNWQYGAGGAIRPNSLYAATKAAFQQLLGFYCGEHGFRALSLVLYDVYGPADERPKFIPELVRLAGKGADLDMTEGRQRISLVHVDDVIAAYLRARSLILELPEGEHRVHFLPGQVLELRAWVERILAALPEPPTIGWGKLPYRDNQIMEPWVGPVLPGWEPKVPIEDGIRGMLS